MTILEKIDEMRQERGWSINNLAMEAMLTQSTVNNLYMRKTEPKISTLRAICDAFGITLAEFFSTTEGSLEKDLDSEIRTRIETLSVAQKEALLVLLKSIK